jgi:hypothetical protein
MRVERSTASASGLGLVALTGHGLGGQVADRAPTRRGDAGAGGDGRLDGGVAPLGRLDEPDAAIPGAHHALELEGGGHLGLGVESGQLVAPDVEVGGGDPVGLGQADPLVGGGEAGVVTGFGEGLFDRVGVEAPGVGEPLPAALHDPDADAGRLGRRQRLDLAAVDHDLGVAAPGHVGLDLLTVAGPAGHALGQLQQLGRRSGHRAVPPTVMPDTRSVGCPVPTGTP